MVFGNLGGPVELLSSRDSTDHWSEPGETSTVAGDGIAGTTQPHVVPVSSGRGSLDNIQRLGSLQAAWADEDGGGERQI